MAQYGFKELKKVEAEFEDTKFGPYLQSFKVEVYFEHLAVLFRYAQARRIRFGEINRQTIKRYIMCLRDRVAVLTVNSRLRAIRRSLGHLTCTNSFRHGSSWAATFVPVVGGQAESAGATLQSDPAAILGLTNCVYTVYFRYRIG